MKYVTLEQANSYFDLRLDSDAWYASDDSTKTKALTMAEKAIDKLSFKGLQDSSDLIFPRDDGFTPDCFIDAICEEALSLLNGMNVQKDLTDLHVTSSSVAGFQTTVNEYQERPWVHHGITSPLCWKWLTPYMIDSKTFFIERA